MTSLGVTGNRPILYIAGGLTKADPEKLTTYFNIRIGCDRANFDSYLPHEDTGSRLDNLDPARVFDANLAAINRSVGVVADVGLASHGVGIEIQYAYDRGKPVLAIAPQQADVSRMILGHPALRGKVQRYHSKDQVAPLVARIIREHLRGLGTERQRLISVEGPDFVGKSSVVKRLTSDLPGRCGAAVCAVTDPPWDMPPWDELGKVFRRESPLAKAAEALLFGAARVDNHRRVIAPALAAGNIVVCDRYIDSWFAYQSVRLKEIDRPLEFLLSQQTLFESFKVLKPPGFTILLMADDEARAQRRLKRGIAADKYEAQEFQNQVCAMYEELASRFPFRIARIETTGRSEDEVAAQALETVAAYLALAKSS